MRNDGKNEFEHFQSFECNQILNENLSDEKDISKNGNSKDVTIFHNVTHFENGKGHRNP